MSNTRRASTFRKGLRCPKCRRRDFSTKEYTDAYLHVCRNCSYPVREKKS